VQALLDLAHGAQDRLDVLGGHRVLEHVCVSEDVPAVSAPDPIGAEDVLAQLFRLPQGVELVGVAGTVTTLAWNDGRPWRR